VGALLGAVVDQNVDAPESVDGLLDPLAADLRVTGAAGHEQARSTLRFNGLTGLPGVFMLP
jgi:hypothetical protein